MNERVDKWWCTECGKCTGPVPNLDDLTLPEILEMSHKNKCKTCKSYEDCPNE